MKTNFNENQKSKLQMLGKNLVLSIVLLFSIGTTSSFAQLGGLLGKAKEKVTEKATEKVSKSTSKSGDQIQPDACISNV